MSKQQRDTPIGDTNVVAFELMVDDPGVAMPGIIGALARGYVPVARISDTSTPQVVNGKYTSLHRNWIVFASLEHIGRRFVQGAIRGLIEWFGDWPFGGGAVPVH